MKIEFSEQDIKEILLAKANTILGSEFNEVKFDARYGSFTSATVFFKEAEVENGTKNA
jgi:hypothetical protein